MADPIVRTTRDLSQDFTSVLEEISRSGQPVFITGEGRFVAMTTGADRLNWIMRWRVCVRQPQPGDDLGSPCPSCGHATAIHVGTDACVVCELRAELSDLRMNTSTTHNRRGDT